MTDKVEFKKFGKVFQTRNKMMQEVAQFTARLGRDRVISICNCGVEGGGLVVWYWSHPER